MYVHGYRNPSLGLELILSSIFPNAFAKAVLFARFNVPMGGKLQKRFGTSPDGETSLPNGWGDPSSGHKGDEAFPPWLSEFQMIKIGFTGHRLK